MRATSARPARVEVAIRAVDSRSTVHMMFAVLLTGTKEVL